MMLDAVLGTGVPFFKMQGCGNDFVLMDNRELKLSRDVMADWARAVCRKAFGIGADGMILLDHAPEGSKADYIWHFYNADGSRAEMCGNGARCATRLACLLGMAPEKHVLGTDAGDIEAEVFTGSNEVRVRLTPPKNQQLNIPLDLNGTKVEAHFVDTGVPHTVVIEPNLERAPVREHGATVRFHQRFAPAGTNANFIEIVDRGHINLRTYERGVEDETYACGTGAVASVVVAHALGLTDSSVEVTTTGGERLCIAIVDGQTYLRGAAEIVFRGEFFPAAVGLK